MEWLLTSVLAFFPITAILHNAVFFKPTCMLNSLGNEYTPDVMKLWLTRDPSPYLGAALTVALYFAGEYLPRIQLPTLAFLLATIPLTLWVWDIPFTKRKLCRVLHDGRSPLRSRHVYLAVAALFVPLLYVFH
jgi:hypothetical protein